MIGSEQRSRRRALRVGQGAVAALLAIHCSSEPRESASSSGAVAGGGNAGVAAVGTGGVATMGGRGAVAGANSGGAEAGASPAAAGGAAGAAAISASGGSDANGSAAAGDGAGGDQPSYECDGPGARFATTVVEFEFGSGQNYGQDHFPDAVLGPPQGGGCCGGSTDVTSLGDGGSVVLGFDGDVIVDQPGADFLVFENAFQTSSSDTSTVFAELGIVSVSQDGISWFQFPCTARAYPYGSCAGWHPVFANPKTNSIDPLDPESAGGDPFDLADLGLSWARYVRIVDRPEADGGAGTFDLDAVAVVHPGCP